MDWIICFFTAAAVLIAAVICAIRIGRSGRIAQRLIRSPINALFAGVLTASVFIFIPIHLHLCTGHGLRWVQAFLLSLHTGFRMFVMDGEMGFVLENIGGIPAWLNQPYFLLSALLFLLAPLMSIGFVLSFFKNMSAHLQFRMSRNVPMFVFSELNSRSLVMAKDFLRRTPQAKMVFTDVFDREAEESFEMAAAVRQMGGICFKEDIVLLPLLCHSPKSELRLFIMGDDESENLGQAIKLREKCAGRNDIEMYVFCSQAESEMLLSAPGSKDMVIRRINEVQAVVLHELYENGIRLFEQAIPLEDSKLISVVIVGLGSSGTEMLRTLPWFCQMIGYRLEIYAFDPDPYAAEKIALLCPELIDPAHNGNFTDDGEAQYAITIRGGVQVQTSLLYQQLDSIAHVSEVFVSLEKDSENIRTAAHLRTYFERRHIHPHISAVLRSSEKKHALQGAENYSGQKYDIEYIGDEESVYTEEVLIHSKLEQTALQRHMRWGEEKNFWRYEYNRRSSIAAAIHAKMKLLCGIPGADLPPAERTPQQLDAIRRLEHRRWNAYMRAEGYIYSGSTDKSSRNNLGKMHHCLVTFDKLSPAEQSKDDG